MAERDELRRTESVVGLSGLSGLFGLFGLSRLFGFSGSSNKTNQTNQIDQIDQRDQTDQTDQRDQSNETDEQSTLKEVSIVWKFTLAMATVMVSLALTEASEAGGLFMEMGTGLAGAGNAARAQDASTLFKNPAGKSHLEGNQFQGGIQMVYFQGRFSPEVAQFGGDGGGNPIGVAPGRWRSRI